MMRRACNETRITHEVASLDARGTNSTNYATQFRLSIFFSSLYSKWNVEMRCSNASEKNTKCVNELSQATLEFVTAAVLRSCFPSCSLTQVSALVDEKYLASRPDEDEQPLPCSL